MITDKSNTPVAVNLNYNRRRRSDDRVSLTATYEVVNGVLKFARSVRRDRTVLPRGCTGTEVAQQLMLHGFKTGLEGLSNIIITVELDLYMTFQGSNSLIYSLDVNMDVPVKVPYDVVLPAHIPGVTYEDQILLKEGLEGGHGTSQVKIWRALNRVSGFNIIGTNSVVKPTKVNALNIDEPGVYDKHFKSLVDTAKDTIKQLKVEEQTRAIETDRRRREIMAMPLREPTIQAVHSSMVASTAKRDILPGKQAPSKPVKPASRLGNAFIYGTNAVDHVYPTVDHPFTEDKEANLLVQSCLTNLDVRYKGKPVTVVAVNDTADLKLPHVYLSLQLAGFAMEEPKWAGDIDVIKFYETVYGHEGSNIKLYKDGIFLSCTNDGDNLIAKLEKAAA